MSLIALTSSSSTTAIPSTFSILINEKLAKRNYPLWRAQVMLAIRAAQFEGLLTGNDSAPNKHLVVINPDKSTSSTPNPAYTSWVARDQAVLGYLLSSLTRETLLHVSRCTMASQAWGTLAKLYSSQTRARSVNTRIALATTKKNQLSVFDYYTKMSQLADDLTASGALLHDDELIAYLLAGLDEAYNPVFTSVVACVDPITQSELYSQLLSFEQHTSLQDSLMQGGVSSAMTASRGCGYSTGGWGSGPSSCGSGRGRGHNQRGGFSNQQNHGNNSLSSSRPQCQICSKISRTAKTCWYRYDDDFTEPRTASVATSGATENTWYTDSGSTDHITGDLDKLMMHDAYYGNDQVHTANGLGMDITCIGKSIIPTPLCNLALNNVLHIPSTQKNLISVHRFTIDNDTFIEFRPFFFLIKDQKMRGCCYADNVKGVFILFHLRRPSLESLCLVQ
jgi:hypothetical protein